MPPLTLLKSDAGEPRAPQLCHNHVVTTKRPPAPSRVISVVVPERARGPEHPQGALGIGWLEALIVEVAALAGVDATAPMRRDIARVVRRGPRRR